MQRISVELVPRSSEELKADLEFLERYKDLVGVINVPDLLRLDIRSWEGAGIAREHYPAAMPHIRAMDIDLDQELPMKAYLREHGIKEVLVIEGDPPQSMAHETYPTTSTDVIRKFREEMPEVTVYAGIDQYRSSMRQELYRIKRKKQAGAAGFFTQPFFDMRYLAIYADMLQGLNIYWGVSPVLSARSQSYWERKNNVVFPSDFAPTLEWSTDFARQVMQWTHEHDANIYIMPIKTGLQEYLTGVFA